jgi:hypothetical protein
VGKLLGLRWTCMMVWLPLLPISARMARSRPGFARGVSPADVCYGLSSHSLWDDTAALLKASGWMVLS